jgi:hypothetical protein
MAPLLTPEERDREDPEFHALVDLLVARLRHGWPPWMLNHALALAIYIAQGGEPPP